MHKFTDKNADLVQQFHQLVHLLSAQADFRKSLPKALLLLNKNLGAANAVLFEIAPIAINDQRLNFQRILQVPLVGKVRDHAIPPQLTDANFTRTELTSWINLLRTYFNDKAVAVESEFLPVTATEVYGTEEIIKMVSGDSDIPGIIKAMGIPAAPFVMFPIVHDNDVLGMLFFVAGGTQPWDSENIRMTRSIVSLISNLLARQYVDNNVQLEMQLLADKKGETASEINVAPAEATTSTDQNILSETKINEIIAGFIPGVLFIIDLEEGELVYCSSETFIGYDVEGSANLLHIFFSNIHPDHKLGTIKKFFAKIETIKNGETFVHEFKVRHRQGYWIWLKESIKIYKRYPTGKVRQYMTVMQDITAEKEASIHLEKSEQRYKNFISHSSEGIYYTNCGKPIPIKLGVIEQTEMFYENAFIQECNLALAEMYGLESEKEMIGQKIANYHEGETYEKNRDSFYQFVLSGYQADETETIEILPDGGKKHFLNRGVGIIENDHLIGMWGVQQDITEKRLAEEALRETEFRLTAIVEDTGMGIWEWNWKTRQLKVNDALLKLIGKDYTNEFDQEDFFNLIHPEDRQVLKKASFFHVENNTDNFQSVIRLNLTDDKWFWMQVYGRLSARSSSGKPLLLSGVLLDIHQLKVAGLLLKEGEALLKATLNAMPDTQLHVRLDGTIRAVYSSQQTSTEQAYLSPEVKGKNLKEVMPAFIAQGLLFNAHEAVKSQELQTFEYLSVEGGETYYYEARINQINETEAVIILRDISSVKKTENDLNEQVHKYDQNVRELKKYIDSNLQLENFAYIASHDLREPLRTMRMFGQFLKKRIGDQLDSESLSHLEFIISSAKRMNELIEGILVYSRVDTDPLDKEIITTVDLLNDSIFGLSNSIEEKQVEVVIEEVPEFIYGSKIRLQQVFQNLVANGLKFSQAGISPRIVISGKETSTHWVFSVADNGIGIKEEFFDQIFLLFKKLHNHNDFEGAGIGLALLKRIVDQHQGEIWLESEEKVGTTFSFSLEKEQ